MKRSLKKKSQPNNGADHRSSQVTSHLNLSSCRTIFIWWISATRAGIWIRTISTSVDWSLLNGTVRSYEFRSSDRWRVREGRGGIVGHTIPTVFVETGSTAAWTRNIGTSEGTLQHGTWEACWPVGRVGTSKSRNLNSVVNDSLSFRVGVFELRR